jgi:hypothetical protein
MKLLIENEIHLIYNYSNVVVKFIRTIDKPTPCRVHDMCFEIEGTELDLQKIGSKAVDKVCIKRKYSHSPLQPEEIRSVEIEIFHVYKSNVIGALPIKSKHIIMRPEHGDWFN